jgi:hypothetical protein
MHPVLSFYVADALAADRIREAERFRRSRVDWAGESDAYPEVTVRVARQEDAERVQRLADLDGHRIPQGTTLVAEVGGELLAARSLDGKRSIADPFHPTAHLVELLELRSAHLRNGAEPRGHGRGAMGRLRAILAPTRS